MRQAAHLGHPHRGVRKPGWQRALRAQAIPMSVRFLAKLGAFFVSEGKRVAGTTGLEPATSDVTGRRSNQLNYVPAVLGGLT
jgi:hypothetical protein